MFSTGTAPNGSVSVSRSLQRFRSLSLSRSIVRPAPADPALLAAAAALPGLSAQCAEPGMQNIASTDVGDLSQVMPVVNFTHGGTAGALHSADFAVTDVDKAYIAPAKMMALTAYHLLKDGAVLARRTMDGFTPVFTRESYIETVRRQG